jgi:hypothetical protein
MLDTLPAEQVLSHYAPGRDETPGVRSANDGICTVARDDEQRIATASPMLDGLHSHVSLRTRRKPAKAGTPGSARPR